MREGPSDDGTEFVMEQMTESGMLGGLDAHGNGNGVCDLCLIYTACVEYDAIIRPI